MGLGVSIEEIAMVTRAKVRPQAAWESEKLSRNVLSMCCALPKATHDPKPILLIGDAHWDNPKSDWDLLRAHLDEAKEVDCPVLIGGDFFCAMQGKYDKRSSKDDIRPEHQSGNYLDRLVDTAADWLEPYKNQIRLICLGNHETAISKNHETDLTDRLCAKLRDRGSAVQSGGYGGWVRMRITDLSPGSPTRGCFNLHYHHGFGGGGPVTMGKIDFNRYATMVDYDIMWAQHVHNTEIFDTRKAWLNSAGEVKQATKWHIRTPTYKDEYQDGFAGFHVEKGRGPRPLGGVWLDFYRKRGAKTYSVAARRTRE